MAGKKFKDLILSNAFLFAAALSNPEICRLVLEIILGRPVPKVDVRPEYNILFNSDFHCVRMDIYARDELQVGYDLEMQTKNEKNLSRRSRYYQAEIDVTSLEPGEDYNSLKPSMIIFICTFDPFGEGLYQYTYEQRCLETGKSLDDGAMRIFLNTRGKNAGQVPVELVHFLKYVENGSDTYVAETRDHKIRELHERVAELKKSRGLEARYMLLEEYIRDEEEKARAEGLAQGLSEGLSEGLSRGLSQGLEQMLKLISCMVSEGRKDEIPRLSEDPEFCRQMLEEYHL